MAAPPQQAAGQWPKTTEIRPCCAARTLDVLRPQQTISRSVLPHVHRAAASMRPVRAAFRRRRRIAPATNGRARAKRALRAKLEGMSKAFTKEESVDGPPLIPARAPLPDGVPNYVTPAGLARLQAELRELETERADWEARPLDDTERAHHLAIMAGRLLDLKARLHSAVLVDRPDVADQVRFGATVTVRTAHDDERRYTIVGLDEADAAQGKLAFVSPMARALLGRRRGEMTSLRTVRGEEELEIVDIGYERSRP
jgi:transcription elongation factor GreB